MINQDMIKRVISGILALIIGIEMVLGRFSGGMLIEALVIYTIMVVLAATNPSDNDDDDLPGTYRQTKGLDFLQEL